MSAYLVDRLLVHPRVTVRYRSEVTRLDGGDFLEEISMKRVAAATGEGASAIASVHKAISGLV